MDEEFKLKMCRLAIGFNEAVAQVNAFAVTLLNADAPADVLVEWIPVHRNVLGLHKFMAALIEETESTPETQCAAQAAFQTHDN